MEPAKLLASGLSLEESKAKRQEKQAARYRHRLGCAPPQCMPVWFFNSFRLYPHMFSTYVPSGDSKDLLAALMATSPRKSPAPRKSIASGSAKRRKSTKTSMNDNTSNGAADDPTHDMEKQTKAKKSKDRKSIKATNSSEEQTQCEGPTATLRIFGGAYHTMCSRSK